MEGYVVSFIAPHTLTARALVVAPDDTSTSPTSVTATRSTSASTESSPAPSSPGQVVVGFRDDLALLAQLEGESFYRRIREKFGRLAH